MRCTRYKFLYKNRYQLSIINIHLGIKQIIVDLIKIIKSAVFYHYK